MRNIYRKYQKYARIFNTCNLGKKTDMRILFTELYSSTEMVEKLLDAQRFTMSGIALSATYRPPAARRLSL
jgi:hypothetical protein